MMLVKDYAQEHDRWFAMAMSITKNPELSKDLVQEVYLKLLNIQQKRGNLNHLSNNGKPNPVWMFITIRNQFIDYQRKLANTEPLIVEQSASELDAVIERENKLNQLWEVVKHLNSDEASQYECQYFLYYVGSGKSLRTIAAENNTTVRIIQNAINNAKRKIKNRMDARGRSNPQGRTRTQ